MSLISCVDNNDIDGVRDYDNTVNEINKKDIVGDTALACASRNGNIEITELLLEIETINVNLQDCDGNTALIIASRIGNIEIVNLLLTNETINVNFQNKIGYTALTYTSKKGNIEMIKLLLAKGATVIIKHYYSYMVIDVLTNWKTYLPRWNRFKTYKYYPEEFNDIAIQWLLICKRKNYVSKDIKLLMIEYFAESWKLN